MQIEAEKSITMQNNMNSMLDPDMPKLVSFTPHNTSHNTELTNTPLICMKDKPKWMLDAAEMPVKREMCEGIQSGAGRKDSPASGSH